ncbi:hypothetical protein EI42_01634 [Thermosporothrix hazakensis]|uniref:Uncharacterized protein n=1 Tax=Thermosporothrix hazakensis TaxID=644383 RepID=A0A326UL76_THEHA|nr:hypothetical protein EI42_01634 [Thermosporothrix hazakensis]
MTPFVNEDGLQGLYQFDASLVRITYKNPRTIQAEGMREEALCSICYNFDRGKKNFVASNEFFLVSEYIIFLYVMTIVPGRNSNESRKYGDGPLATYQPVCSGIESVLCNVMDCSVVVRLRKYEAFALWHPLRAWPHFALIVPVSWVPSARR